MQLNYNIFIDNKLIIIYNVVSIKDIIKKGVNNSN